METNKNNEDLLNSLLNTNYIDLGNVKSNNLNQLSTDDILRESQKLVNDAIKNKTIGETKDTEVGEIKKTPSLKINTSVESNVVVEDEIPTKYLSNPIEFVNYIEYQLPKEKTKEKQNTFILKKYEIENNTKFYISGLNPQEELSLLLLRVNAIDLSDDGDYLFAGFSNGNIAVYELISNKCKLINDSVHKTSVINVKFIKKLDKKVFRIFTSDEEGNVLDIVIKSGVFGFSTSKTEKFGMNSNFPPFLIHYMKFKENEVKTKTYLQKINKTLVLGNLENIHLF